MNEYKLAIVIPFYKIDFFEDTLRSLAEQSNHNFNVYIGSDASPDNPEELIKQYNIHNNFHYKRFEENIGSKGKLSEQWERCIDLSKDEDWIMILADDDYISTNLVDVFYTKLETAKKEEAMLLRFKMRRVSENNEILIDLEQPYLHSAKEYVWEDEAKKRFISISENIFTRKMYSEKKFRKYPLAWRVPMMMYMDFTNNGNVLGINEAHVCIRKSSQQLTWRQDVNQYKTQAMELFYFDIINEYGNAFQNYQNLKFLKVYTFYKTSKTKFHKPLLQLYKKYGGTKEMLKFFIKKLILRS
ncbi:glycosyltransferase family 2 protein [Chryseobacterium scophthalmum]|uniref:glycosyltransferase family 2 protein n=1 Tax=Chryseobacterium scophthalmum TaxID=59733 RepID=UPI003CFFFA75